MGKTVKDKRFRFLPPESLKLHAELDLEKFDCGEPSLNFWLSQRARNNEFRGGSRTFIILTSQKEIAGFYCLSNGSLGHSIISAALKKNMPNPLPITLLGRLGISSSFQGMGLGRALIRHAFSISYQASLLTGSVGLVTEPINEKAFSFYLHVGFGTVKKGSKLLMIPFCKKSKIANL